MANTLTSVATMMDAAKGLGLGNNQLAVIDVLTNKTPFIEEAHWEEANDFTTHHYMQTLSEPTGSDTVINLGVDWELGTERPVTEIIQGLESYSKIDTRILKRHPNPDQYRRQKDIETVRGMNKSIEDRILYGNTAVGKTTSVSPDQILGLHGRFNAISSVTYNEIQGTAYWPVNVVNAGGSSADVQSSCWAVKWGPDGLFMIHPRDGQGFVEVDPLPDAQIVYDANSKPYTAEITHFEMGFGIGVGDWRCVQRLCNINKATDSKGWTSDLMVQLLAGFPDDSWDGVVMYVNRTVWVEVQQEAKNNANSFHFDEAPWGRVAPHFMGVPIKVADRLVSTEPVIS